MVQVIMVPREEVNRTSEGVPSGMWLELLSA
jgi:hypothetical protein